jgi:hypothetical protein
MAIHTQINLLVIQIVCRAGAAPHTITIMAAAQVPLTVEAEVAAHVGRSEKIPDTNIQ